MIEREPYRSVDHLGRPIKRPYPWERDMTVCIAAQCKARDGVSDVIVLCADARTGSALGSAETAFKIHQLRQNWALLASGDEPDIFAMAKLFRYKFRDPDSIKPENLDASIRWPLFERKKILAEEYIRNRFAISFDDFIKFGKEKLPDDLYRDAMRVLGQNTLHVDAIVAGFSTYSPEIYHFQANGKVCIAKDYAVSGSGEYLAEAALLRRGQTSMLTLDQTLYNVYEAKKLSEAVGSVGVRTTLMILDEKTAHHTSIALDEHLEKMFEALKPRAIPDSIGFDGVYTYAEEKAAQRAAAEEAARTNAMGGLLPGIGDGGSQEGQSTPHSPEDETETP